METEKYTDIHVRCDNRVARISINRPEKLNALRIQTYHELVTALKIADESPDCHIILLESDNGHFSSGNDLSDLAGDQKKEVMECVRSIFATVCGLKKVLVAAVEGVAVGIGTTILLHCDIVAASSKAKFRLPFINLGVCPEGGASALLPLAIGEKAANEILYTGRFFTAEEALKWGLINTIAEPCKSIEAAMTYMEDLLRQPLESLVATKALMRRSKVDVESVVAAELQSFSHLLQTEETQQRIEHLLSADTHQ